MDVDVSKEVMKLSKSKSFFTNWDLIVSESTEEAVSHWSFGGLFTHVIIIFQAWGKKQTEAVQDSLS